MVEGRRGVGVSAGVVFKIMTEVNPFVDNGQTDR